MLWQSAASVSRCRSYQWRNLSSALCNRKRFDQCCSLSDLYPERVNQVMPCRGVGLGDGKVQFRPIITYCFDKGNGSRCHLPNYRIISVESWERLTCRLLLCEYFNDVILDQCGFCQMPFGFISVCPCGLSRDFNKRSLIHSSSGEECALGIQAGSRSNSTGESNSEIILSFPDLISAIIPHISCFMFVPHSEITVRGALTLRQLFARYAFIGAYVHIPCSHVYFVTSLLILCICSRFDAVVRRTTHRHL